MECKVPVGDAGSVTRDPCISQSHSFFLLPFHLITAKKENYICGSTNNWIPSHNMFEASDLCTAVKFQGTAFTSCAIYRL